MQLSMKTFYPIIIAFCLTFRFFYFHAFTNLTCCSFRVGEFAIRSGNNFFGFTLHADPDRPARVTSGQLASHSGELYADVLVITLLGTNNDGVATQSE